MRTARQNRHVEVITHDSTDVAQDTVGTGPVPQSPRTSRMNRLVSRRLAHKGEWGTALEVRGQRRSGVGLFRRMKSETGETVWHLSESSVTMYLS
jgi:hypothetical protein